MPNTLRASKAKLEPRKVADITRAREILGFSPRIALDTAIARTVEWYRGNPHGR